MKPAEYLGVTGLRKVLRAEAFHIKNLKRMIR